ncbi:type II toxin-antitoxin system VapC family toxin [Euhalothece natronophila Z-M001]|uniref:Type II toxin-antitoxin system VapC family toxin n=1 Tax=Euhalothece natronophila Z-M001 TaxID=522448 RepID=A0A5B8NNG2_9CHRO|nr:type II toxin-antitoxin system VapC family toxin [Euhalothece natronophila]QDZ40588.1 type II toxin-antitoxin system VapC family toxin [Euhalothece natronophila Z-M001]
MILLDTHIWIWWLDGNPKLKEQNLKLIQQNNPNQLGLSIISCWEVAKLVEKNRIKFNCSVEEWLELALASSQVNLLHLTLPIITASTQLIGFHADPADQIIVATAKVNNCPLLTQDQKILNYSGVQTC